MGANVLDRIDGVSAAGVAAHVRADMAELTYFTGDGDMGATNGAGSLFGRPRAGGSGADYVIPDFGDLWRPHVTFLPNGWGVAIAEVGPDLAEAILRENADNQRKVIQASVDRFAADMTAGSWRLTHQGVAFNRVGKLHDGQNRMHAVIASGATVPVMVFFGAGDQPEMAVLDTGKARTAVDAGNVLGLAVNKDRVATVSQYIKLAVPGRPRFGALTHSQVLAGAGRYAEAVDEVHSWFSGGKVQSADRAPIRAAVLAAHVCGHSRDTLRRFVDVLTDRVPAALPGDGGAQMMRQYIVNNLKRSGGGQAIGVDLYLRTCRAILYAVEGVSPGRLYPAAANPFPIPSDR